MTPTTDPVAPNRVVKESLTTDPVAAECERQERAEAAYLTDEIMEGGIVSSEWIREFAAHAAKCRKLIAGLMEVYWGAQQMGHVRQLSGWDGPMHKAGAAIAEFAAPPPAPTKPLPGDCSAGRHCWSADGTECLFCFKVRSAAEVKEQAAEQGGAR